MMHFTKDESKFKKTFMKKGIYTFKFKGYIYSDFSESHFKKAFLTEDHNFNEISDFIKNACSDHSHFLLDYAYIFEQYITQNLTQERRFNGRWKYFTTKMF